MYNNTYFKTKHEAIEYGIKESEYAIEAWKENEENRKNELLKAQSYIKKYSENLEALKQLLNTDKETKSSNRVAE